MYMNKFDAVFVLDCWKLTQQKRVMPKILKLVIQIFILLLKVCSSFSWLLIAFSTVDHIFPTLISPNLKIVRSKKQWWWWWMKGKVTLDIFRNIYFSLLCLYLYYNSPWSTTLLQLCSIRESSFALCHFLKWSKKTGIEVSLWIVGTKISQEASRCSSVLSTHESRWHRSQLLWLCSRHCVYCC